MTKVLVIRKTDKTIHKVPLSNAAALKAYSNRLPKGQQWLFEEMEEAEAEKLPFIDESYVTAGEAQVKVKDLEVSNAAKDDKIKELMAKLEALNGAKEEKPLTVVELVAKIKEATSADEVNLLVGEDTRKGVLDAAAAKIASF